MYDIEALRQNEFPLSQTEIYFNHASISPLPQRTRRRMQEVAACLAEQPWTFFLNEGGEAADALKGELAAMFNAAGPDQIVPVTSTSSALSAVALSVDWQEGDNVAFCEVEFPSNAYPWLSLERLGVESRLVPAVDGGLTLEALAPLVDERTRVVAASAIQFLSGHRTNLQAIGTFCKERDIMFVVDAIQAAGHMPIDVEAMHIDVLASGGQKSLLAAPGTGFLYVREGVCSQLHPLPIGPNATQDYTHWLSYDLTPLAGASRFAMGTWNVVGWLGLRESIGLLRELGIENVDHHTVALSAEVIALLQRLGFEVITPPGHGPIVTFRSGLNPEQTDALIDRLAEQHVTVVKHLDVKGTAHVRLSFHAYNTQEELHCFEPILKETMKRV
ncbi:MAG TPA: aminotransferase class V-fold PLP-dependent enzyme [Candidatus Binatia bacterium]|nr:aminotransferase class V-fold PLP-dependent enzyme [Candidatus Binatia bacterium]